MKDEDVSWLAQMALYTFMGAVVTAMFVLFLSALHDVL